jgi:hypothetical protein
VSQSQFRRLRAGDLSGGVVTSASQTIPVAGGQVSISVTTAQLNLNLIETVLSVGITSAVPLANTTSPIIVYGIAGNSLAVGITLVAVSGTTLTVQTIALGI